MSGSRIQLIILTIIAAVLTAVFALINKHYFSVDLYETGDFAANSLLIQDAKHFDLWVGNYSRVGFNHPGPAILYVLAAGEWLLHDCLHLVKSPFAGQIFAGGLYSAFWLSAIALLLFRLQRSAVTAIASWSIFIAGTAYVDHNILTGLWFPHLYYLPFATFTIALMRLISGGRDSLPILAISCGFLIHGHISFLAICGIMVVGSLAIDWLHSRHTEDRAAIISARFVSQNIRSLTTLACILLIFLAPPVIETIKNFPGPLAKYADYNKGNKLNGIGNALAFIAQYWGFHLIPLIVGALLLYFFIYFSEPRSETSSMLAIRQAFFALALSTLAALFYAVVGVDNLSMSYIGIFYYSTPIIMIASLLGYLMLSRALPEKILVILILIFAALPFAYRQTIKPVDYAPLYTDAKIPAYFSTISALDKDGIVLDLDTKSNWGRIWSTMASLEIYGLRLGKTPFCIQKNWHILFTEKAKCTDAQLQQLPHFFVSTTAIDILGPSSANLDDIHFYKITPAVVTAGHNLDVAANKALFDTSILGSGWSNVDGEFVYSEGSSATLTFATDKNTPSTAVVFDIGAYLPKRGSTQKASVLINGVEAGTIEFSTEANRELRKFSLPAHNPGDTVTVQFKIAAPTSPRENKKGKDSRKLGVILYGLELAE
jgi:hypothetical protein